MQQAVNSNIGLACVEAGGGGSGQAGNRAGPGQGGLPGRAGPAGETPPHYPRFATVASAGPHRRRSSASDPGGAARGFASPRLPPPAGARRPLTSRHSAPARAGFPGEGRGPRERATPVLASGARSRSASPVPPARAQDHLEPR